MACNGRGGWLPREDKAADLTPSYQWFDGTSEVYYLTEPVVGNVPTIALSDQEATSLGLALGSQAYVLGMPNGDVASDGAKLAPMKEHLGKVALNTRPPTPWWRTRPSSSSAPATSNWPSRAVWSRWTG
jgi:hypothetical protein